MEADQAASRAEQNEAAHHFVPGQSDATTRQDQQVGVTLSVGEHSSSRCMRPGTWPFASLTRLRDTSQTPVPGIPDEMESFFNLLLYNGVRRYALRHDECTAGVWIDCYFFGQDLLEPDCSYMRRETIVNSHLLHLEVKRVMCGTEKQRKQPLNRLLMKLLSSLHARYKISSFEEHKLAYPNCLGARGTGESCRCLREEDLGDLSEDLMDAAMDDFPTAKDHELSARLDSHDAMESIFRHYLGMT